MYTFGKVLFVTSVMAAAAFAAPTAGSSTDSIPAPTGISKQLFQDLFTAPSALDRFKRLLVDPASGKLLSNDAVKSNIAFDYYSNAQPNPGGKISTAIASTFPILVDQDIATVAAFLNPCR